MILLVGVREVRDLLPALLDLKIRVSESVHSDLKNGKEIGAYSRRREASVGLEDRSLRSFPSNLRDISSTDDENFSAGIGSIRMGDCGDKWRYKFGLQGTCKKSNDILLGCTKRTSHEVP